MRVIIVGAGGHGQVVADVLQRMRELDALIQPLGFVDDDASLAGRLFGDLPVLGTRDQLYRIDHDCVIVAIGDNAVRKRVCEQLQRAGERFAVARHPLSVVSPHAQVGPGSMICAGAIVNTQAVIGAHVILNTGCTVDHHSRIADYAHVAPGAHLGGTVSVEEGALVGIGANVIPARHVGRWSTVGAGAAVIEDVPPRVVAVGVPARIVHAVPDAIEPAAA